MNHIALFEVKITMSINQSARLLHKIVTLSTTFLLIACVGSSSAGRNLRVRRELAIFDEDAKIASILSETQQEEPILDVTNYLGSDGDASNRIVGGTAAKDGQYPWFVMTDNSWSGCAGVLVHPQFVLTAAHCEPKSGKKDEQEKRVFIGATRYDHSAKRSTKYSEERSWVEKFVHPEYQQKTSDFDFVLLKLTKNSDIKPIKMDGGTSQQRLVSRTNLKAIGFGTTAEGSSNYMKTMREVILPYRTNEECDKLLGPNRITPSMICAGGRKGKDACKGDSGGPLIDSSSNVLIGVTSWGRGCGREGYPGVYGRISAAKPWVDQIICQNIDLPPASCPTEFLKREFKTSYSQGTVKSRIRGRGIMVDLESKEDIVIRSLALYLYGNENHMVTVYVKEGSYTGHEKDPTAWRKICNARIRSRGADKSTRIPESSFTAVRMTGGRAWSFFIVLENARALTYLKPTQGTVLSKNPHLTVRDAVGRDNGDLRKNEFETDVHRKRLFDGVFYYSVKGVRDNILMRGSSVKNKEIRRKRGN